MAIPDLLIFHAAVTALHAQVDDPVQQAVLATSRDRAAERLLLLDYPPLLAEALLAWLRSQEPTALLETIQRLMATVAAADIDLFLATVGDRTTAIPTLTALVHEHAKGTGTPLALTALPRDWQEVVDYLERPLPEPPLELAGPLVVIAIVDRLLDDPAVSLEQRCDLQLFRNEAEQKLGAMRRIGKIEAEAEQQIQIEAIVSGSEDLWHLLDAVTNSP